jgi:natural product precursor
MKKLGKLKLNQFSKAELENRQLNALKGGCNCSYIDGCVCICEGPDDSAESRGYAKTDGREYVYGY